ncbi:MAG: urea ABC transporter permease subunit UrtB, partial [Silicimonas sp.]|nr:urea ABC transporter permease subunit UrtB [Silicimonas sp.]
MSVLRRYSIGLASVLLSLLAAPVLAQDSAAPIQQLLQSQGEVIAKSSRKTIGPAIDALATSGLPQAQAVLERWQGKEMWRAKETGLFVYGTKSGKELTAFDFADGAEIGTFSTRDYKQLKPNSGIRSMIGAALVQFQLADPEPANRARALDAIGREAEPSHLAALRGALEDDDPALKARKARLERLLTIRFAEDEAERIAAIESFGGDLGVDYRAALTPLVATSVEMGESLPEGDDVVGVVTPGRAVLSREAAYDMLVAAGKAAPRISRAERKAALLDNIEDGRVGGIQLAALGTEAARDQAYAALAAADVVPATVTEAEVDAALDAHVFYERFTSAPPAVALAASAALSQT